MSEFYEFQYDFDRIDEIRKYVGSTYLGLSGYLSPGERTKVTVTKIVFNRLVKAGLVRKRDGKALEDSSRVKRR